MCYRAVLCAYKKVLSKAGIKLYNTVHFSLVKHEQKDRGTKRYCCTENGFGLTPAKLNKDHKQRN